ncbi:cytochrome ubiquinol oxidase subunit I [Effusibacillus dendaii]|uniref:Cytochrome ubiquinol oxidase subunit I n=1 Tax=Effusibacillus dendaii TaxID=2743772 RepID=A0A7I8DA44_9BACL|nr:cytochrome ubiquinol oxidase subunit I [Effusibacillus dendaii]BCJ87048.1 cytochrome ubiquinol oxidase subunit I [Effusibacillus dendaii]
MQDTLLWSRILTSLTLGFHIIFATIGVGVPVMIMIAEWLGIRRNDPHYMLLARRWSRGFTVTVAVGVVTGTCIGLQLSLLWPSFMQIAGQVIALPLFMETFAFFFEAIFLGIYLYTWDRFKNRWLHWAFIIPVVIGSSASAFFITTVNAFMNAPQGFTLENGVITHIEPLKAMFNPATPTKVSHVLSSAFMTSAAILAAVTAWLILRGRRTEYYKKALRLTVLWTFVFGVGTALIGDLSGKYLAEYQPEKLAAAEWHFETKEHADLLVGGVLDEKNQQVKGALPLPGMLSFLAHSDFNAKVTGLNEFPKDVWPPLFVHYLFDLMVGVGVYAVAISLLFLVIRIWNKSQEWNSWLLRLIVLGGPLSVIGIELGWMFAEIGRQPWILRGYMRTSQGVTTSSDVGAMLILFALLYLVLGVVCIYVLLRMTKKNPPEAEMQKRGITL